MYVSYDYYRIFYFVAKHGSFTHAAEALLQNQPNLTRAIKTLEAELGCTLFVRSNKGVRLTPDGERLYAHVSSAMEHLLAGEEELQTAKSLEGGTLSIGASEIALRCFLLPILNQYRRQYPSIRIKISNYSTPRALSRLKNDLVDLAIVTTPLMQDSDLLSTPVKPFLEIPVAGDGFRELTLEGTVSLHTFAEYPIVSLGIKTSTYDYYLRLFQKHGLDFDAEIEAATADQLLPLIQYNLGIGFVPEDFLSNTPNDRVYRIPLDIPYPEREIVLVKKRSHALSRPARELERMILENQG